ncbi:Protein of unknown function [Cotesia congregata]|uniref:Uncharacterized protein n=1 Tax=Cotesia congregata TaxID=51543 RepID=A0A8J2EK73_COTCN|nr:Protein of unknown function [Cotesia congregata]
MENKIFALLRWVGGEYRGTYTSDVPVEWIKDFDVESFDSENEDPDLSYVVEWRVKNKMPKKGWPCADAQVVAVSGNVLKNMTRLDSSNVFDACPHDQQHSLRSCRKCRDRPPKHACQHLKLEEVKLITYFRLAMKKNRIYTTRPKS